MRISDWSSDVCSSDLEGKYARVRKKFGMLFQGGALFDSLPVWRNVTFGLTQGHFQNSARMRAIAEENLERVGLGRDVLYLRPSELSGGMQTRDALARAIAHRTEIPFLAETTTGLHPNRAAVNNKSLLHHNPTRDTP